MDPRRLEFLLALSRLGSMREVADELAVTTSTVSQQLAALAREAGTPLIEPQGRRVRLTPAGRRLADHAVVILAAIESARADLDPTSEPAGEVRVASYATAVRRSLLPVVGLLRAHQPRVRLRIHEHEPAEALDLLAADDVDLALTYDYNLAPRALEPTTLSEPLGTTAWALGVPTASLSTTGSTLEVFAACAEQDWIVNSRNTADDEVVGTVASMAGFRPRITHRADSLGLVQQMIVAGLGVGLLPGDHQPLAGVTLVPLRDPEVVMRSHAVTRAGRGEWPPLALVLGMLRARADLASV